MVCLDCWDWCISQSRAVQCIATLTHVPSHSPFMCSVGETKNVSDDFWVRSLFVRRRMFVSDTLSRWVVGLLACASDSRCMLCACACAYVRVCARACVCVCSIVTMFVLFCSCRLLLSHLLTNCWDGGTVHCLPRALYRARIQTTRHTRIRTCTTLCPCLQWSFVQSPTPEPATWDPYLADRRQVVGDLSRRC